MEVEQLVTGACMPQNDPSSLRHFWLPPVYQHSQRISSSLVSLCLSETVINATAKSRKLGLVHCMQQRAPEVHVSAMCDCMKVGVCWPQLCATLHNILPERNWRQGGHKSWHCATPGWECPVGRCRRDPAQTRGLRMCCRCAPEG